MVSIGPVMVLVNQRNNILLKVTVMQNYGNVVKPGELAEVAVPALPGKILHAKVVSLEKATGGGALYSSYEPAPSDRLFAVLHIEEDLKGAATPVTTGRPTSRAKRNRVHARSSSTAPMMGISPDFDTTNGSSYFSPNAPMVSMSGRSRFLHFAC
jgi:hypothetical protein